MSRPPANLRQPQLPFLLPQFRFGHSIHRVGVLPPLVRFHPSSPAVSRNSAIPDRRAAPAAILGIGGLVPKLLDRFPELRGQSLYLLLQGSSLGAMLVRELKEVREQCGAVGCKRRVRRYRTYRKDCNLSASIPSKRSTSTNLG